jgi:2-oxoglutarate dehydrogenase E2 component (dihydrolipoamide succinyltransferase)
MASEIKVPQMGESVNEAVIGAILIQSGSSVKMDEEILELETDKVNQVLTAPSNGKLELTVKTGETVRIGQVIGQIEEQAAAPAQPAERPKPAPAPSAPLQVKEKVAKEVAAPVAPKVAEPPPIRYTQEAYLADLQRPAAPKPEEAPPPAPIQPSGGRETRQRMTKIRQTIAKRLVQAQREAAMLTTFNEIDMGRIIEVREKHRDDFLKRHGVKLGFMSWFVKGCVAALEQIPALNSYIDGEEIVHREYYDIGIAVGTERGLMVPVVRGCERLSFAQVEQAIATYAAKAREGKISVDDLRGGGFTITNGGIYGSLLSTPILNFPQSGILGMHAIQQRPVAVGGEVVIRPMMYVALSYDHRIVDGEGAVTFLIRLKNYLENPSALLLDL